MSGAVGNKFFFAQLLGPDDFLNGGAKDFSYVGADRFD